jgi:hypothetical protein
MSTLLRAAALADIFGRRQYGQVSGTVALFTTLARAAAPYGTAVVHAYSGSYAAVFWTLAACLGLTAAAVSRFSPRSTMRA